MPNSVVEYFQAHSLDPEFIDSEFGVTWNEDEIIIPVYDKDNNFIFNRYRLLSGNVKFKNDTGSHYSLFAANKISNADTVVVCEGEPDCMRLWQDGIPAVTGTAGVKTLHLDIFKPLVGKKIYLCLDNDEAGISSVTNYVLLFNQLGIKPLIIDIPAGFKDVCEYLTQNKYAKFKELMDKALTQIQWLQKNKPEFQTLTAEELAKKEFPDEQWIIDKIVPKEGISFWFGDSGTGKSLISLSLAKSIATGESWLNNFEVKSKQKVLFIDKENTQRTQSERVKSFGLENERNIEWLSFPEHFNLVGYDEKGNAIISEIAQFISQKTIDENIGVIVLDSFIDIMTGDENSSGATQAVFESLKQLFPNKALIVLHHENKPIAGAYRNSAQRARGSTNIKAQVYTQFRLENLPKSKTEISVEQTKARDSLRLDKFLIEMEIEHLADDKTHVTGFKYLGVVPDKTTKKEEAKILIEELLCSTAETPSRKEIIDHCFDKGIGQRTTIDALKELERDCCIKIEKVGGRNNYTWTKGVYTEE